ncbi:2-keto-4-pentenoate hydratase [Microaceticoccus formicicus]|uniref:2-keto-4-pentenoate hydratase n=1 Tax=Microaceticoccus formicicus TaxID=3118105 RepID=UPI003CD00233|nr:fumarylacetoacetate hydrolase family protein [Peptoniphilaceae bacterium AMB_02]
MVDHRKIASELYNAELENVPIEQITKVYENLSIDDAYKIQIINIEKKISEGKKITGKKIGLTSKAMQESLGVDTPDFGFLYDSMEVLNGVIPKGAILQPRVEGELALILKRDLGDEGTIEEVWEATEYVVPAIEIVGSRIKDWKLTIVDTIADNASCGMYLLSDVKIDPRVTDLRDIQMKLYKNEELINSGYGSAVLDNPANAVLWLAKSLRKYGVNLNKGDIVLAGALSAAIPAVSGDCFVCDFGEFGRLEVDFE